MPYTKIVQYGDTIELYEYENSLKKRTPDTLKAHRLYTHSRDPKAKRLLSVQAKRRKERRELSLKNGLYKRSRASIRRSRVNFFRLCHHNNCRAKTIHFLTLTFDHDVTPQKANRNVKHFMERVAEAIGHAPSYISVPEYTKKNRLHFHLLIYNLPPDTGKKERATRNFQRQFRHGFLDLRHAPTNSTAIAGYMAKYMGKALSDQRLATRRGFTCSRNIEKVSIVAGNTLSEHLDLVTHTSPIDLQEVRSYDVPYLGRCRLTVTKRNV